MVLFSVCVQDFYMNHMIFKFSDSLIWILTHWHLIQQWILKLKDLYIRYIIYRINIIYNFIIYNEKLRKKIIQNKFACLPYRALMLHAEINQILGHLLKFKTELLNEVGLITVKSIK